MRKIIKRNLLGRRHLALVLLVNIFGLSAQTITVKGTVTDTNQEPVIGATIVVSGNTGQGVVTDYDGNYTISGILPNASLHFSYVGMKPQTVPVSGRTLINIILEEDTELLDEVVVIGYGTQKKNDLTGSITAIGEKDFQKGVVTDPASLISGKVAGVQITSNGGRAGGGTTIRIRGGASLNASNDPLIVIDGMPVDANTELDGKAKIAGSSNALSMINPNDIESMNILKDASATAIYGSRASNGVIIVTTKKGRSSKMNVEVNSQNSIGVVTRRIDVLTGDEFRNLVKNNPYADDKFTQMLGTANTDWQKQIYRTAFTSDNNISISGRAVDGLLPYRVSAGFLSQDGTLKTDNVKRTTVGVNLSPSLLDDHLKININLKGTYTSSRFGNSDAIGSALRMDPTKPVTADGFDDLNGYWAWLRTSDDPNASGHLNTLATRNPVALLYGKDDRGSVFRSLGNMQLDYKMHFLPDLRFNLNLGYDISKGKGNVVTQPWSPAFYTKGKPSGERSSYNQENRNLLLETYLNYTKQLNDANRLEAMAGYSYQDWLTTNRNFPVYYFDGTTEKSKPIFAMDKPQHTLISFYTRFNYTLLDRYMLTATVRHDGSSRFGKDNRWGTFPSVAFAWRISEEDFLKEVDVLSNLKLRLGWGLTGQQEIGNYEYLAKYSYSENTARVQFGDKFYNMYRPDGYDSKRKWESTTTTNIGLDFGFLNNRINGSIDIYNKGTKDLLNDTPLALGGNFRNRIVQNIGKMTNKGIETNINFVAIDNREMSWELGFNFTYNQSKITQLTLNDDNSNYQGATFGAISGGTGNTAMIHSVGYTPSMFYVYKQLYTPDGKPIDNGYADLNGDGVINEKDRYRFHSSVPKYYMGFNTSFTYQRWTAASSLRASIGNYIFNNTNFDLATLATVLNTSDFLSNTSPDLTKTMFYQKQKVSDYFVENASFLKMDYIQLSYDIFKRTAPVGMRANATIQNVFTLTKYTGIDPEIQGGIDNNFYPNSRTFTLGLSINF